MPFLAFLSIEFSISQAPRSLLGLPEGRTLLSLRGPGRALLRLLVFVEGRALLSLLDLAERKALLSHLGLAEGRALLSLFGLVEVRALLSTFVLLREELSFSPLSY